MAPPNGQVPHWRGQIDGKGGTFAYTTGSSNVKYDSEEAWHLDVGTYPPSTRLDLWSTAAHEMGHTLHIDHPSSQSFPIQTMWTYWDYGDSYLRSLENYDID